MTKCPFCSQTVAAGVNNCPACGAFLGGSGSAFEGDRPPGAKKRPPDLKQADDLAQQVLALLEQGRKIEAVRVLREATGASLADARRAVEALEAGDAGDAHGSAAHAPMDAALEFELVELLQRGTPLAAIKVCMQRTGAGLAEARTAVDALAKRRGLRGTPDGCGGVFAVLLIVAVVGAIVAAAVFFGLGS